MGNVPQKSLGLLDATLLVAGSMIGSGIFIVSSIMMNDIGSPAWMLVLWVLTGVITILAALSYGELAGMMPNAGGQYVYIQRAFGRLPSFLYGWTVFTVIQTGVIAAVAVAFAKYTAVFFPSLNDVILDISILKLTYGHVVAIGSVVILTYSNAQGLKNGKIIQFVFTSAKLFALFALIILGIYLGFKTNVFALNMADAWRAFKTTSNEAGAISTTPLVGWALVGALGATIINSLFSADAWILRYTDSNRNLCFSECRLPHVTAQSRHHECPKQPCGCSGSSCDFWRTGCINNGRLNYDFNLWMQQRTNPCGFPFISCDGQRWLIFQKSK